MSNNAPASDTAPCGHYDPTTRTVCMATPTRQYLGGRRCHTHQPVTVTRTLKETP